MYNFKITGTENVMGRFLVLSRVFWTFSNLDYLTTVQNDKKYILDN